MEPRFSCRLPWPARTNALAVLRARRLVAGLPVLDLSESNPSRLGLRHEADILGLFQDLRNLDYAPDPRGLPSAREALSARYATRGTEVGPERLFLCSSTSEAYGWLFKLLADPGDAVLVPRPGYPLFDWLAGLEGIEARPYRLEYAHPSGWHIDLDSVRRAMDPCGVRAIVLINPNNPTGSWVGSRERSELVRLCERSGVALVVDEVFFDHPVEGGERRSFAGEDAVLTFVLDGLSKLACLPQMKLGWIAASGPPGPIAEALGRLEIIADAYLSAGTPVMNALPGILERVPAFTAALGGRLSANMATLRRELEGPGSPHRVLRCGGGWTAIVESPRYLPEEELACRLLEEEGLMSQPGYFFDMEKEAFFTASLILEPDRLLEGAGMYRAFFERLGG